MAPLAAFFILAFSLAPSFASPAVDAPIRRATAESRDHNSHKSYERPWTVSTSASTTPPSAPASGASSSATPSGSGSSGTGGPDPAKAAAVIDAFRLAWDGYYKYAFPNDELWPVSNSFGNSRNGWGASAIDALSTALVMELEDIVGEIVDYIPMIDFSVSYEDEVVSVFETTIRYLGGMLSGYDFLTGPLSDLYSNKTNIDALLSQAIYLADLLSFAFETPSGVPSNNIYFNNRSTDGSTTNGLATIGTLVLEWTHLSDLTGDGTYAQLTQAAENYLLNPQPAYNSPWPGLVGTNVALSNGSFVDASGGWQGGDDSYYEYLLKMYVYDSSRFASYKDSWVQAVDSSIAHLTSHPSTRPDLTFLAEFDNHTLIYESQHLACFDSGNFILGGSVLGVQEYINFGLELVNACHDTYISDATGIGPESFAWFPSTGDSNVTVPASQSDFYQNSGFWILDGSYILRPEVMESYYYAYRITGDSKYQDWAWQGFTSIRDTTKVGSGFSSVNDVNIQGGGGFTNNMESFLFAEVMKYSYLIFAPEAEWQVMKSGNEWVFNTEAHPFKVAKVLG